MSITFNSRQVRPYIYQGYLSMGGATTWMWVDMPTVIRGTGKLIFPSAPIVLDWIFTRGTYPTNPESYDTAYIRTASTSFNFGSAIIGSASDTRMALSTLPAHIYTYGTSMKPLQPWDIQYIFYDVLPNHGVMDPIPNKNGPCFIGFSRRSQDSSQPFYCGNYNTVTVKQGLLLASSTTGMPSGLMNMISVGLNVPGYAEPFMFWGFGQDQYTDWQQYLSTGYVTRFTVPHDTSYGSNDTVYTYYEDTYSYNYGAFSASSAPWLVIGAPGWASRFDPAPSGSTLLVIRATLAITFS